jgi:FixJ family two-component response regulator
MDSKKQIIDKLQKLSQKEQNIVLNIIDMMTNKDIEVNFFEENANWSAFSLAQIMNDMEDEPDLYSTKDMKFKLK